MNLFIDTGASVSLVSTRTVHMLNLNSEIRPSTRIIAGLKKSIIPTRGQINMCLTIGKCTFDHTFIVCDQVDNEFLIGMDIIHPLKMCIDVPNHRITMPGNNNVTFLNRPVSIPQRMKIRCHKTTTIPPNSQAFLSGKLPLQSPEKNFEGIIEPYHKLTDSANVFVTGTISYTDHHVVPIHCVNPTDTDVTIYKNQLIAFIEPLPKHSGIEGVHRLKGHEDYDSKVDLTRLPEAESIETTISNGKWDNVQDLLDQLRIENLDIPDEYKSQLKQLVSDYSHCFSRDRFDLGCCSFYKARLNLKHDFVPKWVPTRPISYKIQPHLEEEILHFKKSGTISECKYSLWNSAIFMVQKSTGAYRFVYDARALNSQIVRDSYELPKINNILDKINENTYWSSFDLTSSFTQVPLLEESRDLTAFTFNNRRYRFNRLIQGQTNSSAEFSRMMTQLFAKVPFNCLLIYIDDILLASNTIPEHLRRLKFILQRLEWGNLKLSPKKTHLFQKEVSFLGHRLSSKGISIDSTKIDGIVNLPPPTSVKQVQKFLGMVNYHRNHIPQFASKANALYGVLRKDRKFEWSSECQNSFDQLKKALTTAPILGFPDYSDRHESYHVICDSSKSGHGAVLSQWDGKHRRVLSYFSKSVPKHLQKLGATKLEMLGLLATLKHWKLYLQATKFKVFTDCKALLNLQTIFSKENSYVQRRLAELSGFDFTISHISGESQEIQIADYLSRYGPFSGKSTSVQTQTNLPPTLTVQLNTLQGISKVHDTELYSMNTTSTNTVDTDTTESDTSSEPEFIDTEIDNFPINLNFETIKTIMERDSSVPIATADIQAEYDKDIILKEVIGWVKAGRKPIKMDSRTNHHEIFHYWKNFKLLSFSKGLLKIKRTNPKDLTQKSTVVVLPHTMIEQALYSYHDTMSNCHSGVENSLDMCSRKFYFYKMRREFKLYINACLTCNRTKQATFIRRAPLKPIVYSHFGQAIQIDHIEPSKKPTPRGHVAILTITDMFTSYLVCVPVRSVGTEETIRVIIEHWICKFGMFNKIHHDRGSGFTSKLFRATMAMFGIKDKPGCSFQSTTQGKVESQNKRLNACMRACLTDKEYKNYDLYVKYIVLTLNSLKTARTNYSANFLVFSKELTLPRDLFMDDIHPEKIPANGADHAKVTAYQNYKQARDITRKVIANTQKRIGYMCNQADKKATGPFFEKGQYCFLLVNVPTHKFSERWMGPYLIAEKITDWNYVVCVDGLNRVVNISKMKPYEVNKYSKVPQPITPPVQDTNSGTKPPSSNKTTDIDSSDDDDVILIFNPNGSNYSSNTMPAQTPSPGPTPAQGPTHTPGHTPTPGPTLDLRLTPTQDSTPATIPSINFPSPSLDSPGPTPNLVSTPISPGPTPVSRPTLDNVHPVPPTSSTGTDARESRPAITLRDIDNHAKKKGVTTQFPRARLPRQGPSSSREDDGPSSPHRSGIGRYLLRSKITSPDRLGSDKRKKNKTKK